MTEGLPALAVVRLILAVLLPWCAGMAALTGLTPGLWHRQPATALGAGFFLGWLMAALILAAWSLLGWRWEFAGLAATLLCAAALLALLRLGRSGMGGETSVVRQVPSALLLLLVSGVVLLRYADLGLELYWRPLTGWDAWTTWAPKSKVWFHYREYLPFVDPGAWIKSGSMRVFTLIGHDYPDTVPLIQTWMALGSGAWTEFAITLPWFPIPLAIALLVYGEARYWGVDANQALIGVWFFLTVPLVNTHVAIAGYADPWLAGWLCMAVALLLRYARNRRLPLLLALVACVVTMTQVKGEGAVYGLALIGTLPAIWMKSPRRWWLLAGCVSLLLLAAAALGLRGASPWGEFALTLDGVALPGFRSVTFSLQPVLGVLLAHLWVWDSWHLYWYLVAAAIAFSVVHSARSDLLSFVHIVLAVLLAPILFAFFFTDVGRWVADGTLVDRVFLQMAPAVLLLTLLMLHRVQQTEKARDG